MAVDEALLESAADGGPATLRFYQWSEPTLSLGYFQRYDDRQQHAASRDCTVVRRQSGGGAILHDHELTYSITLPASHPLARNTDALYCAVHHTMVKVLSRYLDESQPHATSGFSLRVLDCGVPPLSGSEPFVCFQRRAPGDVVVDSAADLPAGKNVKILGSAQRRLRGAILQHGSLLLKRSTAAPELDGFNDLSGLRITATEVATAVSQRLCEELQLFPNGFELASDLRRAADAVMRRRYESPEWTRRR